MFVNWIAVVYLEDIATFRELLYITFPRRYSYFYCSSVFLKKVKQARLWSSENEKNVLEGIAMFRELF